MTFFKWINYSCAFLYIFYSSSLTLKMERRTSNLTSTRPLEKWPGLGSKWLQKPLPIARGMVDLLWRMLRRKLRKLLLPCVKTLGTYLTTWGPLWTSLKRYELLTLGWSICPSLFPIQLILSGFVHTNLRSHAKFQVKILISYSCSFHEKFNTEIPMSNYPKSENWQKRG